MKNSKHFTSKTKTSNGALDVCLRIANERVFVSKHDDHISAKAVKQVIDTCHN